MTSKPGNQGVTKKHLCYAVQELDRPLASFQIAPGIFVGDEYECFIIAEVGQNHQGDFNVAKKLIEEAVDIGADCVKFQKTDLKSRFTKKVLERPYTSQNAWGNTYGEHKAYLEFTKEEFQKLSEYARQLGILFTASGMDKPSFDFLNSLDVPFFKIGSGDSSNMMLCEYVATLGKPIVLSTGMANMETVTKVHSKIEKHNKNIGLLQCTSAYPCPPDQVHLSVIKTYKRLFPWTVVGYSGHEVGIGISIAAVASGAKILERHLTLDRTEKGSDHKASLEPKDFKRMIYEIRRVEDAMGSGYKSMQECEIPFYEQLGKSIVATRDLKRGTIIDEDMIKIGVVHPKGWEPHAYYDLLGRKLKKHIKEHNCIFYEDVI